MFLVSLAFTLSIFVSNQAANVYVPVSLENSQFANSASLLGFVASIPFGADMTAIAPR